jgi:NTE family protein
MPQPKPGSGAKRRRQSIDLALQGGGSHGAFTWGVLDRLLDEAWLTFDGVSGTSAGALNAAVLASGLAQGGAAGGGRAAAQTALRAFWDDVAQTGAPFGSAPRDITGKASAMGAWLDVFTQNFSPYQFNPFDINPLRDIVRRHVDIEAVRAGELSVFVNATAVRSGRPRIFDRSDLSHDALLASACLPQLFRAVEIDGPDGPEPYWDGGYSGNPALWPLIYHTEALDLVLVKIDPLVRLGTPDTPHEIHDRINEITFNAGLVSEMRAIAFVQKLHLEGRIDGGNYKNLRLHMVADEAAMQGFDATSKLETSAGSLRELHRLGHAAAERWLAGDAKELGRSSTLDLRRIFLGEPAMPKPRKSRTR